MRERGAEPSDERERLGRVYAGYAGSGARARSWDARNPGNRAIRDELLAGVLELAGAQLDGEGRVLDAGCGNGFLLAELVRRGVSPARLHGVDLLEERVSVAGARAPGATVAAGDVADLPHPDGHFSLVTLLTVLSSMPHGEAVRRALAEARRVTEPGGRIIVYEPRLPNPLNPNTRVVRRSELARALGPPADARTLTVLPPLARRLGARAEGAYPRLARLPALRTHRLQAFDAPGAAAP